MTILKLKKTPSTRPNGAETERYVRLPLRPHIAEAEQYRRSRGQTLIIVALMMTVLLLIVGLGVDVGNLMGKRSKLQSAVDAAALSAAQLLADSSVLTTTVVTKANQMLEANGVQSATLRLRQVTVDKNTSQVRVQAVQKVDTFFMRLIPIWRQVDVSADATADLNSYAEINTKPYGIPGVVNELNISVWGVSSWRKGGDAYSPQNMSWNTANVPEHAQMPYGYLYRIDVPDDFADNHLLVQIFDPDSWNQSVAPPTPVTPVPTPTQCPPLPYVCPTRVIVPTATPWYEAGKYVWCASSTGARIDTGLCLGAFPMANPTISGPARPAFWRVDEIRLPDTICNPGPAPGNCGNISGAYVDSYATRTQYTLWHFDPHITSAFADPATLSDLPGGNYIARYTGSQTQFDSNGVQTDRSWYLPSGFDIKLNDPADPSCNHNNHDCYARESNGNMYFYLYIQGVAGSSENNFDLRVGPKSGNIDNGYLCSTPCNVNQLYFNQMNDATIPDWDSGRVFIFAKRALPLNLDTGDHFPMLFTQVSKNAAGQTLAIRHFDQDCTDGCGPGHTFQYQMQLCLNQGGGNYVSCPDTLSNGCFGNPTTGSWIGYMGPDNGWYCSPNCPSPEKVHIPIEGTADYTRFFGPNGECASSWLRLQSNPSYSQDTTVWEMPFARPRLIK
jgi:Flp pilus assembly protein TadG